MKNIVLIGGSYGIGLAIAELMQNEYQLYILARTAPQTAVQATFIPFDAGTDEFPLAQLPDTIDGFVYCPGSINLRPFRGLKMENFEQDMQVNFFQMARCLQAAMPRLTNSVSASVVLFSSVAASMGMPFHSSIAAAKGAVEGFAKAIAAEYAPQLRVNVIAPSLTHTPLADKFLNSELKQEKANERHPLKRYGQADDMAQMAVFLLSEKSSWMSGQVMHLDGGMSTLLVHS
ncbi:MAG: SDR family oxidoreductase [Flavobacterium sp.]|nr:SDR family oxidoreductase [Flavobacterium sp.]